MTQYVEVAVPLGVRKTFHYSVPAELSGRVQAGSRILVPFGRKLITGFAVRLLTDIEPQQFQIKPIRSVIDPRSVVAEELLETALWVANYYFAPPGQVISALFPAGTRVGGRDVFRLSAMGTAAVRANSLGRDMEPEQQLILKYLDTSAPADIAQVELACGLSRAGRWIEPLIADGWVRRDEILQRPKVRAKTHLGIEYTGADGDESGAAGAAQRRLLRFLSGATCAIPLQTALRETGCSLSVARALERKGLARISALAIDRVPVELSDSGARAPVVFTAAQRQVFDRLTSILNERRPRRCLLHGVTGSGKTEIYLRLIAEVLRAGDGAIFLVPEIGLTPLLSRIVTAEFPGRVAILHSGLSAGERFDQWNGIRSGSARVVLGTRSAVFAPLERPRLVIIDEEQDASYKQDESPCYHAREVAWQRVQRSAGMLLMGSATPSIETYHSAIEQEGCARLSLAERIEARPMPEVVMVDMSLEFRRHGKSQVISERLKAELKERLARSEQSIVLLNRRGFSRSLLCRSCGHVSECPDCSVSLTYHREEQRLVCHYCGAERMLPQECSSCGGTYIYFVGTGTEQLEQILQNAFPRARIARLDRDSTRRRGQLRKILLLFDEGKLDILVGTQMVAKGHDFPNVTLVGVVSADAALSFPDFRAAERTFQLLTQVAGRAGRGSTPGRVVIQTFYPNHYALTFAQGQDYRGFYEKEAGFRRLLGYPPFKGLTQILVQEKSAHRGAGLAEKVGRAIRAACRERGALGSRVQVLGPAPAPVEKVRGLYRYQLLLKTDPGVEVSSILHPAFEDLGRRKAAIRNVHVDVDSLSLL